MKATVKYRGDLVSYDGGATYRSAYGGGGAGETSYMGASYTSRELAGWRPGAGSADADLLPELDTLKSRSRDLERNEGYAKSALRTKADCVVGPTGLKLSAMPDYRRLGRTREWAEEWSNEAESLFRPWAETTECDASGLANFAGLSRLFFQSAMLNGDALALPLWLPRERSPYRTRLQVIEGDRLSNPLGKMDGPNLRGGKEIDEFGRPLAYWIRKAHPGDMFLGSGWNQVFESERIEAETPWGRKRVLHGYDAQRAGQQRGAPDFSAVLQRFKMLDHYQRTEIQAAVAQAMVTMFIETPLGEQGVADMLGGCSMDKVQEYVDRRSEGQMVKLKGASAIPLFPGERAVPFTPSRPNAVYGTFVENVLRNIAAGLDLPLELLTKDFTKTTYTSARAMLLEAWRFFMGRRQWLADTFCSPVYVLWLEEMVSSGQIEAPGFYDNIYAYTRCEWIGMGKGWVDATKEVEAAGMRMALNLSTLQREAAEQGLDWEELVEQRAVEVKKLRELGLPVPEEIVGKAKAAGVAAEQTAEEDAKIDPVGQAA